MSGYDPVDAIMGMGVVGLTGLAMELYAFGFAFYTV
jgi:hypothetical protein